MNVDLLKTHTPWLVYDAIEWLKSHLTKDMLVYEYGSGGSTLFLADLCKVLHSVEYDFSWYNKVIKEIEARGILNCDLSFVEPEEKINENRVLCFVSLGMNISYSSKSKKYENKSFMKYVQSIDRFEDNFFDLIVVDGRSREACIVHSISKVKLGGYILLDNSERLWYESGVRILEGKGFEKTSFFGHGPNNKDPWETSVFKKTVM